jgi:hypothetical protein
MPSYRVDFLNEFARGDRVHKVCQRSIFVGSAESPETARDVAIERFTELEGIRDWRIHAAIIEIVCGASQPDRHGKARAARRRRALANR